MNGTHTPNGNMRFAISNGVITGPADYMRERFKAWEHEAIELGKNACFNAALRYSPNVDTAILVSLQTDWNTWNSAQVFAQRV